MQRSKREREREREREMFLHEVFLDARVYLDGNVLIKIWNFIRCVFGHPFMVFAVN
jgi:hypothetical protein